MFSCMYVYVYVYVCIYIYIHIESIQLLMYWPLALLWEGRGEHHGLAGFLRRGKE